MEKSKVVIDLCAAPGSWCQVALECCPVNSLIIGVDLAPIKPLPNVITFQSDITTEHCRSQLRSYMKTWKADTVMHDGAPNVGMAWAQDAFTQSELVLQSLKLGVEFLAQGGTFVTKVFRSKDYNNLMWVFQQFFDKVEATKPPSSRNVSAEIFVVCRGFKAPKKVDPRLLDPKAVFEELSEPKQDNQAKVFNPEIKKRKRDGYEEGDYTQYHTTTALEFIKEEDPIEALGSLNAIIFDHKAEPELKPVKKMASTTPELFECFKDLKVLGKKDFKLILKWRKSARKELGLDEDKENKKSLAETVEEEPIDEDTRIERELNSLKEKESSRKKREKRRENERKQKEIMRMQMNMDTPLDIGLEAGGQEQSLFNLKQAERSGQLDAISKGKKAYVPKDEEESNEYMDLGHELDERENEEIVDDLEVSLNDMYEQYKQKRAAADARSRALRARDESEDEEWFGIKDELKSASESDSDSDDDSLMEAGENDEHDSDDDEGINKLIATLRPEKNENGLSRKASLFFSNPLFKDAALAESVAQKTIAKSVEPVAKKVKTKAIVSAKTKQVSNESSVEPELEEEESSDDDEGFETVPVDDSEAWEENVEKKKVTAEIVSAQAMTLAHEIALGHRNKHTIVDEGYNRYAFRDRDGLPEWFLEDEAQHSRISKPITKEAVEALKAKFKAMNARPTKKVMEAQARKKMRAAKKLEKLRKKTDLINEDEGRTERDKAEEIQRLTRKLTSKKKEKPKVTVVAARGFNRGVQGRPRGVKGKYKMVDGTMKKEQRALRRIQKKRK